MRKGAGRKSVKDPVRTARYVLLTMGGGIALVGLVELALLWFPPGLGVPAWEFGTLNETSRILPSAGLGLALLVYGITRNPQANVGVVRATSLALIALAALFASGGAIYARAVPVVLAAAPAQAVEPIVHSTIQTGACLVIAIVCCLLLAGILWRGVEAS